jgi:hypothetical protein
MTTLAFQGTTLALPDGSIYRRFDYRVPCSPDPTERVITLTSDSAFAVNLDGMTEIHALDLESDSPVTVVLTSTAGTAQSVPVESMRIVSRAVPFTAISLVRVAGQATTVRLILGQSS